MSQRKVVESDQRQIRFDFTWAESSAVTHSVGPTYGKLAVWVCNRLIWGSTRSNDESEGISGSWIDLLEYLNHYWLYLRFEQGYPFNVMPRQPTQLNQELESRWERMGDDQQAEEEELVYAFKMSHNLAEAAPGSLRPDIWIVRDGGMCAVEAQVGSECLVEKVPSSQIKELLTAVGDTIADRLQGCSDLRSVKAMQDWSQRESKDFEVFAKIVTGRPDDYLRETCGEESFENVFRDPDSSGYDDNVYLDVTYRCKGFMLPAMMRGLIDRVRNTAGATSHAMQNVSIAAMNHLANLEPVLRRPYQQGRALARWLRQTIGNETNRISPEDLLRNWDVAVDSVNFGTRELDAVAFWAHSRCPTILWNDSEKHRENEGARRATLAHEICHLLVDRLTALPLSVVARGAIDRGLEQRANAFAAELLCPENEIQAEYLRTDSVEFAINAATTRFGVSQELAAVQLGKSRYITNLHHQAQIVEIGPLGAFYSWSRSF